jgi:hypothetical protein
MPHKKRIPAKSIANLRRCLSGNLYSKKLFSMFQVVFIINELGELVDRPFSKDELNPF